MNLFAFLSAAVGPLAVRVLMALGVGVLTFAGVNTIIGDLQNYVATAWQGMPGDMAQLVGLAGADTAVGMVLGAMGSRVSIWVATSATRWGFLR